ncbi:MAG: glycosyltransferase family 4 protein [Actinomycetota bacterium]
MAETPRVAYTIEQCWHRVPGGTAVTAIETARALVERKTADLVGVAAWHRRDPPLPFVPPIPVKHLPLPRTALYEAWHRLRLPPVGIATGPVDVIHATSIAVPPRSAPLVVTIHDLLWLDQPEHFTPRGLRFFHGGLRRAQQDADLVLCPSRATLDGCAAAGFEPARLRLVPMGVAARPASREDVERVRGRYRLARPYVLWVGTIEPRKNLRRLIEAFDRLDADIDLVLVGPEGWNETLGKLLPTRRETIRPLGFVPRDDLAPLYSGAEVFCFPSLLEGFGLPVLEAMAQRTPVVTSRGTSTEELARDAGVLVDPYDSVAIADGISRLLDDAGFRERVVDAGTERVAQYPWTRTAELVGRAYAEVA